MSPLGKQDPGSRPLPGRGQAGRLQRMRGGGACVSRGPVRLEENDLTLTGKCYESPPWLPLSSSKISPTFLYSVCEANTGFNTGGIRIVQSFSLRAARGHSERRNSGNWLKGQLPKKNPIFHRIPEGRWWLHHQCLARAVKRSRPIPVGAACGLSSPAPCGLAQKARADPDVETAETALRPRRFLPKSDCDRCSWNFRRFWLEASPPLLYLHAS